MARKQALPADQLDRLNKRYRRERDALVDLTKARIAVAQAACAVDAASERLEEARRHEHQAYQQVVALVGAAAAVELTGGQPNEKPSRERRPSRSPRKHTTVAAASAADHEVEGDQGGDVTGQ